MGQLSIWSFPTRIVFGAGAAKQTGAEAKRLGSKHALVVTDKGVVGAGLLAPIEASLREAGIPWTVFDGVLGNPVEANVHDGVRAFRTSGADLVIAVGGGSPLDVGKLVRLGIHHHRPLAEYDDAIGGDQHITANVPPMLALPTTAGTGSEVGRSGVVTLDVNHRKTVIFSPHLLANAALLDPELTRSMPAFLTAATGIDALTHCLEAYVAKGDHPMADGIALEGIRHVGRYLERAVKHGVDLEARGGMMKAAMMGAVAFQKGLGACHSLAHPLSSEHGTHHGLANALCLPAVCAFNAEVARTRLAEVSVLLGGEASPAGCVEAVRRLRERIGLPATLSQAGVPRENLDRLADLAFQDACHTSNPRPCTRDDLRALYEASF
ncbi:iron-containing alcohol dehydrogenase [Polyangium mundeleinium]|uniref:Iron-containing alcohol dehydrogenase n=1 Tax=Polyangium mundeleinium TaxID=2995306 RepID=A0ABT5EUW5_9BACT|nr:iron-containing alcohol dehydrogenase [Polyangium mundeleinium]MDC0745117.1 iron-containing alcohol dehydrogenase [Polyangium mundeleinium]